LSKKEEGRREHILKQVDSEGGLHGEGGQTYRSRGRLAQRRGPPPTAGRQRFGLLVKPNDKRFSRDFIQWATIGHFYEMKPIHIAGGGGVAQ